MSRTSRNPSNDAKANGGKGRLRPNAIDAVVFGYDNDGNPLFYYPEEGDAARDGGYIERRYADCSNLPANRRPVLGLIRGGEGLWFDKPSEWADADAEPNGWVAYSATAARTLIGLARVGDLLVPLGSSNLAQLLLSAAP